MENSSTSTNVGVKLCSSSGYSLQDRAQAHRTVACFPAFLVKKHQWAQAGVAEGFPLCALPKATLPSNSVIHVNKKFSAHVRGVPGSMGSMKWKSLDPLEVRAQETDETQVFCEPAIIRAAGVLHKATEERCVPRISRVQHELKGPP